MEKTEAEIKEALSAFFSAQGLEMKTANVKLSPVGGLEHCTGTFGPSIKISQGAEVAGEFYAKHSLQESSPFFNTEITVASTQFILIQL